MTPDQALDLWHRCCDEAAIRWAPRDDENGADVSLAAIIAATTRSVPVLVTTDALEAARKASAEVREEPVVVADWTTVDHLVARPADMGYEVELPPALADDHMMGFFGGIFIFETPLTMPLSFSRLAGGAGTDGEDEFDIDEDDFEEIVDAVSWSTVGMTDHRWPALLDHVEVDPAAWDDAINTGEDGVQPGVLFLVTTRFGRTRNVRTGHIMEWSSCGVGFTPCGMALRAERYVIGDYFNRAIEFAAEHHAWPVAPSEVDFVALIHTLNAFASAEVIETVPAETTRAARRRADRAGRASKLNLLRLPHRIRVGAAGSDEDNPMNWTHRWWVRPHWRTLHRGTPDERRVRVKGYVKGPDDQPFVAKDILGRL